MTDAVESTSMPPAPPAVGENVPDRRMERLLSGLREVSERVGRGSIDGERLLFLLGAIFAPLGMLLIGIGWYGTSGSGLVFEQVPYVVSGGIAGLGFVLVGCTLYACWWITRSIREQRERHAELMAKQDALLDAIQQLGAAMRDRPSDAP